MRRTTITFIALNILFYYSFFFFFVLNSCIKKGFSLHQGGKGGDDNGREIKKAFKVRLKVVVGINVLESLLPNGVNQKKIIKKHGDKVMAGNYET